MKLIPFIFGLTFLALTIMTIIACTKEYNEPIKEKVVPCYDRYSNVIEGVECKEITNRNDMWFFTITILGAVTFILMNITFEGMYEGGYY